MSASRPGSCSGAPRASRSSRWCHAAMTRRRPLLRPGCVYSRRVAGGAMGGLMPEVARFEPPLALDGGMDGLAAYRAIAASLGGLLAPGGTVLFEVGAGQATAVAELLDVAGLTPGPPWKDLGGVA